MFPLIIIGAIAIVPVLLALFLRVNAVFVFISIAIGYFLQFALSDDIDLVIATLIKGSNSMVVAQLVLLLAPVILTLFIMRKSIGKSPLFQLLPLVFSGLFLATVALPLLPEATEKSIYASAYGSNIKGAQDLVIAVAVVSNLLLMWSLFKHHAARGKHHR